MDFLYVTDEEGWFGAMPAFNAVGTKGFTKEDPLGFPVKKYQHIQQIDGFTYCVLNKQKTVASGEEALKDISVIEAIFRSIETAKEEKIS